MTVVRRLLLVIAVPFGTLVLLGGITLVLWKLGEVRFARAAPPGTPQSIVQKQFGKPASITTIPSLPKGGVNFGPNSCGGEDRECWLYLSRIHGDLFVCFNEARVVTCTGRAMVWR
jgi:hypothetical protein